MKKFEIGKVYKTENGCDAHILHVNAFGQFEGILKYDGKSGAILTTWDKNGYCISGLDLKDEYKLVREVEMKQEISMDKKYVTSDGRNVTIISIIPELRLMQVVGLVEGVDRFVEWALDGQSWSCSEELDCRLVEVNPYADFKVDDKVLVRNEIDDIWIKGYFGGTQSGYPAIFSKGVGSYTFDNSKHCLVNYDMCVRWEDRTDDMVICDD